jgi:hypothetical protein
LLLGESVAALLGDDFSTEECGALYLPDREPIGCARLCALSTKENSPGLAPGGALGSLDP